MTIGKGSRYNLIKQRLIAKSLETLEIIVLLEDQIFLNMKIILFFITLFLGLMNHCESKPVQSSENIEIKTENGFKNSLFAQLIIKQSDYGSDIPSTINI